MLKKKEENIKNIGGSGWVISHTDYADFHRFNVCLMPRGGFIMDGHRFLGILPLPPVGREFFNTNYHEFT